MIKKLKKVIILATIILYCSCYNNTVLAEQNSSSEEPLIYDIILFWGQSNMVGFTTYNFNMPNSFDRTNENSVKEFSLLTGIDKDILSNTYTTSLVKTPIKANTGYIYKSVSNSLEAITKDTVILGDGFDHVEPSPNRMQGLSYINGSLVDYYHFKEANGSNAYLSIQTSGVVNMIPEFVRTYYEKTGHGVIAVNGGVGGANITDFLPVDSDDSEHKTTVSWANYLYEAMVLNFKQALKKAEDDGMIIGDSYWVSFQGESNVRSKYDTADGTINENYVNYYNQVVEHLSNDLKISEDDTVEGALIETSFTYGMDVALGVRRLHNAQEKIINDNDNIILGSSIPYDYFVPDKETYNGNNAEYNRIFTNGFSDINIFKDENGNDISYDDALNQANLITCNHAYGNGVHFHSATLSQIGRETATNLAALTNSKIKKPVISDNFKVENQYLKGISLDTRVEKFNLNLDAYFHTQLFNSNNESKLNGNVATGDIVKIYMNNIYNSLVDEYTVIIKGDVTGTGSTGIADIAKAYQHLKGKIEMDDMYVQAGDVAGNDGKIKITDVTKLYQFMKNKINFLD